MEKQKQKSIRYMVDLGDHTVLWSERKVKRYYERNIDHNEYATYDDWMGDMWRMALVVAVI